MREEEELFSDLPQPRLFHKFREGEVTFLLGLLDREMGCWSRSECSSSRSCTGSWYRRSGGAGERERGSDLQRFLRRLARPSRRLLDLPQVRRGRPTRDEGRPPRFRRRNGRRPSFLFFRRSCLSWPVQVRYVLPSLHNDDNDALLQRERRQRERTSLATTSTKAYSRCRPAFLCPGPSPSYGKPRSSYKVVVRRQNSCSDELPL